MTKDIRVYSRRNHRDASTNGDSSAYRALEERLIAHGGTFTRAELDAYFKARFEHFQARVREIDREVRERYPRSDEGKIREEVRRHINNGELEKLRKMLSDASGRQTESGVYSAKSVALEYNDIMRDYFPWFL